MSGQLTAGASHAVGVPVATLWTGPEAPRPGDAAALGDRPDVRAWVAALSVAGRRDLHGRVDSQVLLGEPVIVDEVTGSATDGWVRVVVPGQPSTRDARGYPGWLPREQLVPARHIDAARDAMLVVTALTADTYTEPGGPIAMRDVSFGTLLSRAGGGGAADAGWLPVAVAGRGMWIRSSDVDTVPSRIGAGEQLLEAASTFLGLEYLWGGRSGLGVDCSGLAHLVHQRFGVMIPRDAHDQASGGVEVDPAEAAPGDLLFFAGSGSRITHVGFAAGGGRLLHAPETGRRVELITLPEERRRTLVAARRYWT